MKIKLRYLVEDVDRHGNVRCYVRVPGQPKIRLRANPGSVEFMGAYQAAVDGLTPRAADPRSSFGWTCKQYFASKEFERLDAQTQGWRRRVLERICDKHGGLPIAKIEPKHIRALRDELSTPVVSNQRLKALRALFNWACEKNLAPRNPVIEVKRVPSGDASGHHTWTLDEVAQFEERHPVGSMARLATALMLYTAGRREDAIRLGPKNIRGDRIVYTQAKNEHRKPVHMSIPLHPELRNIIDSTVCGLKTFLITSFGKPFTPMGFSQWFRDRCDEAELKHCSAHGLRKATATVLANRGATPHMIQAITGHASLQEVERYTQEANKAVLADAAMALWRSPTENASGTKKPKNP
jgi:integrase/recombinase XerD